MYREGILLRGDLISLPMMERFIGFDTVSRNSNLPLIEFVRDHLLDLGFEVSLTHDDEGRKANLLATIGPREVPGIVLSGHTDVVPVNDQAWTSDPFKLTRRDDRFLGRGVVDMKGFLAIATAYAGKLADAALARPVHLAMSYDEEVGCLGVPRLVEDLARRGPRPYACIVGEPSGMELIVAHKGKIGGRVSVTGLAAHSGVAHIGINAVEAASEAVARLKQIGHRLKTQGPFNSGFEEPSYTTIQTCRIEGGTAVNIVPAHCVFDFDIRYLPGEDPRHYVHECKDYVERNVLPGMKVGLAEASFDWVEVPGCLPLNTDEDEEVVDLARILAEASTVTRVGFGTEAGYFQEAGIPTVICGPGDIGQAHKPDEFITLDQIARCENFMKRMIDHACTP
jgi:acetylornithine deacetylase